MQAKGAHLHLLQMTLHLPSNTFLAVAFLSLTTSVVGQTVVLATSLRAQFVSIGARGTG